MVYPVSNQASIFRVFTDLKIYKFLHFILLVITIAYSQYARATLRHVRDGALLTNLGTSWADASGDLQLIINNSVAGDSIWVSAGTFIPTRAANDLNVIASATNRNNAFVLKNGVKILGGFPVLGNPTLMDRNWIDNVTTLNGDLLENDGANFLNYIDNSYHVVISAGVDSSTVLDGFTIRGGNTSTTNDSISVNGQWVRISRGAGWVNVSGNPTMANLIIKENRAANNNGGGVYNQLGSPTIMNIQVCGNQALAGGGFYNISGSPKLHNTLFNGNSANNGGGWFNGGGNPVLTNATFSGNNANTALMGGGWQNGSGSGAVAIRNSIFWGNDVEFIINGGSINLTNCIEQNGLLGGINENPKFVNAIPFSNVPTSLGDYEVMACSPAINSGSNGFVSINTDLNNFIRTFDAIVDIGAYEYQLPMLPVLNTIYDTICAGGQYAYNGNLYTTTQITDLDTFITVDGCDSILVLNLWVKPYPTHLINATICQGQSYIFNGVTYTTTQTGLLDTFTTAGCDSIVTLNLNVTPYITNTVNATICQGQSFTFNGNTYNTAQASLLDTFTTAGCDSIVSLNISVTPYITNTVNATICQGQSYTFNGNTYNTVQASLLDTFATAGCDSIVTLNIYVTPYITNTANVTICQGQTYTFNGNTYTSAQVGILDTFATNGCDSIVTLNLNVTPYITNTVNATICQGQTYTFNGNTYTSAQTGLLDTFATAGCDSIVTLNLIVTPYITNTVNANICQGQSYTFNGVSYTTAQTGLLDTFATTGCDSIVTLNLSVTPFITNMVNATICQGQFYTFNGVTYTTAQTGLLDTFATAGCDSIVTLNLSVTPFITNTVNATICQGQSYIFNGVTYTNAQTGLLDTFATAGCDSIITLNLNLTPYITNTVNATICQGQSYAFNGGTYTTAQTGLLDTFATAGCDSIVTLNLSVTPFITNMVNATICQGQFYTFNGVTYTTAQTGLLDTFNTAGCDSIVSLNISVTPYITNTVNATICQGQSYTFNGNTYNTVQASLLDTFATAGCDSIVTINLSVTPFITNMVNATICQGQFYTFNGVTYTTAQTGLLDTFATAGCDSIVTLNLNVTPYITNTVDATICQGQSYTFNGLSYTTAQTGLLDTFNTAGCDSIVTLNLIVTPYITNTVNATICQGQSYIFNGNTYTTSQTGLLDTFATAGCDSIVTLNLSVTPFITNTVNATICQGQFYAFNGGTYTNAQTGLLDTFATAGCDSIVTLNLSVIPYIANAVNATICQGQSYTFNGVTYTTAQTGLLDTFATAVCDSVVSLNLSVTPFITNTVNATICQGQSYAFNGGTYTTAQSGLLDTFATTGCDSIVTLNLIVTPYINNTVNATICQGQSYTFNGVTYSTAQTGLLDTFATNGCDSVVSLNLSVTPYINNTVNATICQGQSYTFNGVTYTNAQTGLLDTFATAGCDSIVTLNLNVTPYITNTVNATICQGQSYIFKGVTYTNAQTGLLDTFATAGCDSIITLNLNVTPYITNTVNATICQGQSYTFNGNTYTSAQVGMLDTFATAGCDSVVSLNLSVTPFITNTVNANICQGQSFTFNGNTYTTAQTGLLDTFATAGCDSIVTLNLIVTPYITNTANATICQGQSYIFNGNTYTTSQTGLLDTFATAGCDSIVTLNLNVTPYITNTVNATICQGQSYAFNGVTYSTAQTGLLDTFATTGCDSIVTLNLFVTSVINEQQTITICPAQLPFLWNGLIVNYAGIAAATYITTSIITGCDSVTILNLQIVNTASTIFIDTAACGLVIFEGLTFTNSTNFKDTLLNLQGCDSIIRNITVIIYPDLARQIVIDSFGCGNVVFEGITYNSSTTLYKMFLSEHGCDSLYRTVNIIIENFEISLTMSPAEPYHGELVTFTTSANLDDYQISSWSPKPIFKQQQAHKQFVKLWTDGSVEVIGQSANGCIDTAFIYYKVLPLAHDVFIPNAFSPNNDGVNDIFVPQFLMARAYNINVLRIYDRFGKAVYNSSGNNVSWNGNYLNGNAAELGVYHYFIEVEFLDGNKQQFKGDLTLIR